MDASHHSIRHICKQQIIIPPPPSQMPKMKLTCPNNCPGPLFSGAVHDEYDLCDDLHRHRLTPQAQDISSSQSISAGGTPPPASTKVHQRAISGDAQLSSRYSIITLHIFNYKHTIFVKWSRIFSARLEAQPVKLCETIGRIL